MYCLSRYLACNEKYLQCSIDITTEQSFRYMKLNDAKMWIFKMRHCVCFCLQIGLQMTYHVLSIAYKHL